MARSVLFAAGIALFAGMAQAATIQNGSFENPDTIGSFQTLTGSALTGWTIGAGTSIDLVGSYWQASHGSQSIDLSGTGTGAAGGRISQSITDLVVGSTYKLLFDYAANPDRIGPAVKKMFVSVGTSPSFTTTWTFDRTGNTHAAMGWTTGVVGFTATAASMFLQFRNGEGSEAGMALDNVRIVSDTAPVPLPASGALLPIALGLLAFRRRRA